MEEIKFKYLFKDNYNPKYINGAQGGINPTGEIIINFYFERIPLPNSETINMNEKSQSFEKTNVSPDDWDMSFVRVVENGIILNYQTAKELHNWLGNQILKLEEIKK